MGGSASIFRRSAAHDIPDAPPSDTRPSVSAGGFAVSKLRQLLALSKWGEPVEPTPAT